MTVIQMLLLFGIVNLALVLIGRHCSAALWHRFATLAGGRKTLALASTGIAFVGATILTNDFMLQIVSLS